jgi:hypothetical protein
MFRFSHLHALPRQDRFASEIQRRVIGASYDPPGMVFRASQAQRLTCYSVLPRLFVSQCLVTNHGPAENTLGVNGGAQVMSYLL